MFRDHEKPLFQLSGMAIGDGLVSPRTQVQNHAQTAFVFGLITEEEYQEAVQMQNEVVSAIDSGEWMRAATRRTELLDYLESVGGTATLLDVRRDSPYDGDHLVQTFLNQEWVKTIFGVRPDVRFYDCNPNIDLGKHVLSGCFESV